MRPSLVGVATGDCLRVLRLEGPYAGMEISDASAITQAQGASLIALEAIDGLYGAGL